MSKYIELSKEPLKNIEEIDASCKKIFATAIELLENYGEPGKIGLLRKGRIISHPISSKPGILVEVWSGANLKKVRKVNIGTTLSGILEVNRKVSKDGEEFRGGKWSLNVSRQDLSVSDVRGCLDALEQVKREIENPQKPQSK